MSSRARPDLVSVLEAAYAVELPERDWLKGILAALRPSLERGLGIAGYVYDTRERPFRIKNLLVDGCPIDANGLAMLQHEAHDEFVRSSWIARAAMMASETPGYDAHPAVLEVFHPAGIRDVMVVNAIDPIGVGCWIGAPRAKKGRLEGTDRELWNRVATHVRTSLRLRLRLAARAEGATNAAGAEAIMTTAGKFEHLDRAAETSQEALREAVKGIARARSSLRDQPERALPSWKAMVRARWTLVDEYQNDGNHYIVARVNSLTDNATARLSERERQVVACLSMGHTNKEAAYELGLSHSTVRVLVTRACAKLGVASREALVERYRRDTLG